MRSKMPNVYETLIGKCNNLKDELTGGDKNQNACREANTDKYDVTPGVKKREKFTVFTSASGKDISSIDEE